MHAVSFKEKCPLITAQTQKLYESFWNQGHQSSCVRQDIHHVVGSPDRHHSSSQLQDRSRPSHRQPQLPALRPQDPERRGQSSHHQAPLGLGDSLGRGTLDISQTATESVVPFQDIVTVHRVDFVLLNVDSQLEDRFEESCVLGRHFKRYPQLCGIDSKYFTVFHAHQDSASALGQAGDAGHPLEASPEQFLHFFSPHLLPERGLPEDFPSLHLHHGQVPSVSGKEYLSFLHWNHAPDSFAFHCFPEIDFNQLLNVGEEIEFEFEEGMGVVKDCVLLSLDDGEEGLLVAVGSIWGEEGDGVGEEVMFSYEVGGEVPEQEF